MPSQICNFFFTNSSTQILPVPDETIILQQALGGHWGHWLAMPKWTIPLEPILHWQHAIQVTFGPSVILFLHLDSFKINKIHCTNNTLHVIYCFYT